MPVPLLRHVKRRILRRLHHSLGVLDREQMEASNVRLLRSMKACGNSSALWGKMQISGADNIVLGHNVHIGDNAFIKAEGGLSIGDNTHISRNLVLYTHNHNISGRRVPYDDTHIHKPVEIGANVWIGMNVCIVPGTVIGDGAVVGMGTIVSGTVPPFSIITGQKWRQIGERDKEHYDACVAEQAFGGPSGIALKPE